MYHKFYMLVRKSSLTLVTMLWYVNEIVFLQEVDSEPFLKTV